MCVCVAIVPVCALCVCLCIGMYNLLTMGCYRKSNPYVEAVHDLTELTLKRIL